MNTLAAVEATDIDSGDLSNVPYLSFRANGSYEMNIYGNPDDPAALEIGYHKNTPHSHDAQKRCRQFMASYLTTMTQLKTLYKLQARGGRDLADGLLISITAPDSPEAYGGWWVTISNPAKLAAARQSPQMWKTTSVRALAAIKKFTAGETSWRKYSLEDAAKRYLPMEKMEER